MPMNFAINYFAVLVSAIGFMIVGTLWYGPLFGKQWRSLIGVTPEKMKNTPNGAMVRPMIFVFIVALVTSFVIAVLLKSLLITTPLVALELAFVVWLGFIATTLLNRVLFEQSSMKLYFINISQSLVAFLFSSLILVLWPW
ncbi:DUF1761 domain-containing protein [Patescibacteria group bacterium]|nr:DUF1761 domain-containing protein [Patescibacteria group bacterium]